MDVSVDPLRADELSILENLWPLYAHDLSPFVSLEVGDDGRFPPRTFDVFVGDGARRGFLVRVGGRLAGFALVARGSRITDDPDVWDVAEFFILRRHRRGRVGTVCAEDIFRRLPGVWEVRVLAGNTAALAFWRAVVGRLTGGRFEEHTVDDARWRGTFQRFESSGG